jgi:hypothetical protein
VVIGCEVFVVIEGGVVGDAGDGGAVTAGGLDAGDEGGDIGGGGALGGIFEDEEAKGLGEEGADPLGADEIGGGSFAGAGAREIVEAEFASEGEGTLFQFSTGDGAVEELGEHDIFIDIEVFEPGSGFFGIEDAAGLEAEIFGAGDGEVLPGSALEEEFTAWGWFDSEGEGGERGEGTSSADADNGEFAWGEGEVEEIGIGSGGRGDAAEGEEWGME